jgi:hypothetical protein
LNVLGNARRIAVVGWFPVSFPPDGDCTVMCEPKIRTELKKKVLLTGVSAQLGTEGLFVGNVGDAAWIVSADYARIYRNV